MLDLSFLIYIILLTKGLHEICILASSRLEIVVLGLILLVRLWGIASVQRSLMVQSNTSILLHFSCLFVYFRFTFCHSHCILTECAFFFAWDVYITIKLDRQLLSFRQYAAVHTS